MARAKGSATKARAKKARAVRPELGPLQVHKYDTKGKVVGTVDLPPVFGSDLRPDLIRRAVVASSANRRQPHGTKPGAGMRHSVEWSGKGQGVARTPRIRGSMTGGEAPYTRGGRPAFPPRVDRKWAKKINIKERRIARNSALAATHDPTAVSARGHRFEHRITVPVVVDDAIEAIDSTAEALALLEALGVRADVDRAKAGRHIRAGRGKMRGRRYRVPRGPLLVVRDVARVRQGFGNLPGVEVTSPASLSTEALAPGGDAGRLTILSAAALESIRGWGA